LTLNDSNADGIATVNITSNTSGNNAGTSVTNTIGILADTSMSTLNISGAAALAINAVSLGQPNQAVPVGVASLTINDNTTDFNDTGSVKVASSIVTLSDDTLGSLNFTGTNNFNITTLNDNNAVNLTIGNSGHSNVTIGTLNSDQQATTVIHNGLSNLTFTGNGNTTIGSMVLAANTANLTFTNSGTGNVAITALNDGTSMLTTAKLTLAGNISLGTVGTTVGGDTPVAFAKTTGMTIAAGTDNAHLSLSLTGAGAASTDAITVGNANNYIKDGSTAGTVNVTAGTGANYIDLSTGSAATYSASVTLGAHTTADSILTGAVAVGASAQNTIITGAAAGDIITLKDAGALAAISSASASLQATITAASTIAAAIGLADNGLASHTAVVFQWSGNTYIVENSTAGLGNGTVAAGDSIVELVGVHTAGTTITAGHFVLTA